MRRVVWLLVVVGLALPLFAQGPDAAQAGTPARQDGQAPAPPEGRNLPEEQAPAAPGTAAQAGRGLPALDPPPFAVEEKKNITMGKTPSGFEYVLYSDDEFEPWQKKLRRGEALFFGGLPLSYALVGLVCSVFNIKEDFWPMFGVSAAISAAISIADFIVGEREGARDRQTLR